MKTGLVLEGGGLRAIYTVGVLDALEQAQWLPDYLIGVSAGAAAGVSYIAGQKGRGLRTFADYVGDKRYLSVGNYLKTRSLFGMDFIYDEIPHRIDPFDYEAFQASPCDFRAGVTNVATGRAEYYGKEALRGECTVLRASSSLPILSPIVPYNGKEYLDGGVADPLPVLQALKDGCDRVVVVLTRARDYTKAPQSFRRFYSLYFRNYPNLVHTMERRHQVYNDTLEDIRRLEAQGVAMVVAPERPLPIDKFETNRDKLMAVYQIGRRDGEDFWARHGRELKE